MPLKQVKPQESDEESDDTSSDNEVDKTPPPTPPTKVAKVPQEEEDDDDDDSESDSDSRSMITKSATPSAPTKRAEPDMEAAQNKPKQQEDGNKPESEKKSKKSRKSDNAGDKSANVGEGKSAKKSDNAGAKKLDNLGDGKKTAEAGGEEAEPKKKSNQKKKKEDPDKCTSEAEKPEEKHVARSATKKTCMFNPKDESILARRLLDDLKTGVDFHTKSKSDNYWDGVLHGLQGQLSHDFTKDQIYDKSRRMKRKYMVQEKTGKNEELQTILKQLYDREIPKDKRKGKHSDVEESQETSGPQAGKVPGNGNVHKADKAVANEVSRMIKDLESTLLESVSSATVADPVINFGSSLCTGVLSWMKSHKLGSGSSKGGKDVRKRVLEEKVAEYGNMKRRLKLAMDYCDLEEELLQKKLGNL